MKVCRIDLANWLHWGTDSNRTWGRRVAQWQKTPCRKQVPHFTFDISRLGKTHSWNPGELLPAIVGHTELDAPTAFLWLAIMRTQCCARWAIGLILQAPLMFIVLTRARVKNLRPEAWMQHSRIQKGPLSLALGNLTRPHCLFPDQIPGLALQPLWVFLPG